MQSKTKVCTKKVILQSTFPFKKIYFWKSVVVYNILRYTSLKVPVLLGKRAVLG